VQIGLRVVIVLSNLRHGISVDSGVLGTQRTGEHKIIPYVRCLDLEDGWSKEDALSTLAAVIKMTLTKARAEDVTVRGVR
jgi:hypothetical protein